MKLAGPIPNADDRLSRIVSALLKISQEEHRAYEDNDAFGAPSECHALTARAYDRDRAECLRRFNIRLEQLDAWISERISPKAAYRLCFW